MTTDLEKRKHERFVHREPVELSYQDLKKYHRAEMVNYGEGGMCIESIFPFRPGETVYIHAVQLPSKIPFFEPDDNLNAAVRFCRKLDDADSAFHRVGVQFLNPLPSPASRHNLAENGDLRRRAEKYLDKHSDAIQDEPVEDVSKMLHELQVHQTELEMQNEELRLAQAEIEFSRNRYHFLYDFAPIGYFTFNPYGQILEANLTGADYLEVERALLINSHIWPHISRPDQDKFRLHRREVFQTRSAQTCEIQLQKSSGKRFYARIDSIAVQDAEGIFNRMLSAVTDIDAHKKVAQEKKKLEYQLQQAQKMKAIGTLAGGIAHNFNNLLMGIEGRVSLMLYDLEVGHPHYEYLQAIENTIVSATKLTRELLGFARGGKYEIQPADLNRLIESTSEAFFPNRKEIEICTELDDNIRTVNVDRGQIEQVLLNLYVNAVQAMPEGGTLSLQSKNITLNHPAAEYLGLSAGRYVRVTVTDTGLGMDETTCQRIFEPFFTTKKAQRGAGLGLSFVYGVIRNHNGSITVDSEKDKGTSFQIYLPASTEAVVVDKIATNATVPGTETLLLVDDEDVVLEVSRRMLRRLGYEVFTASSGQEALALYQKYGERIELIILDLIMPGMSGGETFDNLLEMNSQIKVLLSSGYNINGEAAKIIDRGCSGFIQKPFNLKDLSTKLREVLDK